MNIYERLTENCREIDCEIQNIGSISTLLGYNETYDRYGNPTSKNPNNITTNYKCLKCNRKWIHNKNELGNIDMITEMRL